MASNALQTASDWSEQPKRVLLVDSNKGNRHLLASQLSTGLGVDIDLASSCDETHRLLECNARDHFVGVVNVKLKDADDGSIVDILNSYSIPVIAFTLDDDRELRERVANKFVLDYVVIRNRHHFEHIEKLVMRIQRSYSTTVLLVDTSLAFRFYIRELLTRHCFRVVEAATVEDALQKLRDYSEIRLVVTDSSEDGIDGPALIEAVRMEHSPQSLGIVAMSASENPEVNIELLKIGANDFIRKPFAMEEFYCRINQNVDILDYISEIRNSMIRDYLTGAYNRRYLYEAGEPFYLNAQRGNLSIAVAMIDADKFKLVNDTYGHDVGDQVLIEIAASLNRTLRASDIVARFGGEEFVCIVNCIDPDNLKTLFERVRQCIEELEIVTNKGVLKVTASIGVTMKLAGSLDDMLNIADRAMYEAKKRGRNCVVVV